MSTLKGYCTVVVFTTFLSRAVCSAPAMFSTINAGDYWYPQFCCSIEAERVVATREDGKFNVLDCRVASKCVSLAGLGDRH